MRRPVETNVVSINQSMFTYLIDSVIHITDSKLVDHADKLIHGYKQCIIDHEGGIVVDLMCLREFAKHADMLKESSVSEFRLHNDYLWTYNHAVMSEYNNALSIVLNCLPSTIACVDIHEMPGSTTADFSYELCSLVQRCKYLRRLRHRLYISNIELFSDMMDINKSIIELSICLFGIGDDKSVQVQEMLTRHNRILEQLNVNLVFATMLRGLVDVLKRIRISKIVFERRFQEYNIADMCEIVRENKSIRCVNIESIESMWRNNRIVCNKIFDIAEYDHVDDIDFNSNYVTIDIAEKIFARTKARRLRLCISRIDDNYFAIEQRAIAHLRSNFRLIDLRFGISVSLGLEAASREINARNRMILPMNVHKILVDICVVMLPHFDNPYCLMWIFNWISEHYHMHVHDAFKIGIILGVKKSVDNIIALKNKLTT